MRLFRLITLTLALTLLSTATFAGTFKVDPILEEHGVGTVEDPFMNMDLLDANITPGAEHTIILVGRPGCKFPGGLGGISLRWWVYGNCEIVRDDQYAPVQFEPTRSIPFAEWNDGPDGTRFVHINPLYDMKATRPYVDMDAKVVLFTRPIYTENSTAGFKWEKAKHKLTVTPALLKSKAAHTTRLADIKAKIKAWKTEQLAISAVASNPDLLNEIEVPK